MENGKKIVLFDSAASHMNLLPLSYTRPVSYFRVGITTIIQKWQAAMACEICCLPVDYLREKFGNADFGVDDGDVLFVSGALLPVSGLPERLLELSPGQALTDGDELMAFRGSRADFDAGRVAESFPFEFPDAVIRYVFDVFLRNADMIRHDFQILTRGRRSMPLSEGNLLIGPHIDENGRELLFIEEGAVVEGAIINTKDGPVYIGRDAHVMEGSCLRGPLALCCNAKVKMGSKVYGSTTIGPYCKVGGEIDNIVMFGYSNKAHDGYLGSAVIGEWCNIGAGTNASNLKNDYSKIRVWNYAVRSFMRTDLQFCGLIMGDHSKSGVNVMFNTATVLGVGVNVHGAGFPRVFVPSFSEGSAVGGFTSVPMKKFVDIADRVMHRRGLCVTDVDRRIFDRVHEMASEFK